jgi:hypothetical protein
MNFNCDKLIFNLAHYLPIFSLIMGRRNGRLRYSASGGSVHCGYDL